MNGIFNIVLGIVFIVGGLSGELALLGTNSPEALAGVGLLLLLYGVYQALSSRAGGDEA
jgi:predicted phage tail protein